MDSNVVGTCTTCTPRMYVAAAKPARSPTQPPPSATTTQSRSSANAAMASHTSPITAMDFASSPAGTQISDTW